MTPRYEVYKSGIGDWYWRFRAGNGRIMADGSEGYCSKRNCHRALWRFHLLTGGPSAYREPMPVVETDA
jgi:uncharacterized protein YegP (UPF0339 family)